MLAWCINRSSSSGKHTHTPALALTVKMSCSLALTVIMVLLAISLHLMSGPLLPLSVHPAFSLSARWVLVVVSDGVCGLCSFLTVREHLQFAVATKLGTKAAPTQRAARIDQVRERTSTEREQGSRDGEALAKPHGRREGTEGSHVERPTAIAPLVVVCGQVLREMGLWECADTYIGGTDPMFLHKGLSGGERKRLSIATELLQCPTILFLDEVHPTHTETHRLKREAGLGRGGSL